MAVTVRLPQQRRVTVRMVRRVVVAVWAVPEAAVDPW